jgi:hypothetical protein
MDKFYHTDLANSFYYYSEGLDFGYNMDIEFDEYWNVVDVNEKGNKLTAQFEYLYDKWNNYTKCKMHAMNPGDGGNFFDDELSREITYYE